MNNQKFQSWLKSDSVVKTGKDSYTTQCTQYKRVFDKMELLQYFIKEYIEDKRESAQNLFDRVLHVKLGIIAGEIKDTTEKYNKLQDEFCTELECYLTPEHIEYMDNYYLKATSDEILSAILEVINNEFPDLDTQYILY